MALSRDPVRFVVFFNGRSGSSTLIEALNSHPEMVARGEILSGKDDQLLVARRFLTRPRRKRYAAVGFKTKLRDVRDPEDLAALLAELGASAVLLRRRNVVKQVVSRVNSKRLYETTSDWNLYDERNRLPPATIDPAWFDDALRRVEEDRRELEDYVGNLEVPTLPLYYEDFLVDWAAAFSRVCSFLGARFEPVQRQSIKNTSDDLKQAVSNFEELRALYAGTPYASMFDEVLAPAPNA